MSGQYIGMKFDEFIFFSRRIISNSITIPEILEAVTNYGYLKSNLQKALDHCDEIQHLYNLQQAKYGAQYQASVDLSEARRHAGKVYADTIRVARVVLAGNTRAAVSLQLHDKRKVSLGGWLEQASAFYRNLLNDQEFLGLMGGYGFDAARLNAGLQLIQQVSDIDQKHQKCRGEAQESTRQRDARLAELASWISRYKVIVKIAMADSPQSLEALGIVVPSRPVKRGRPKKEKVTANQGTDSVISRQ